MEITAEKKHRSKGGQALEPSAMASLLSTLTFASSDLAIEAIRKGFPAESIDTLVAILGIPRAKLLAAMGIAQSTAERRLRKNEPLTADESDRVLRVGK